MEAFTIQNLSFAYPNAAEYALSDVTLTIRAGEFLAVCGPSGGGKTTFLRLLKPALTPNGTVSGVISFEGQALSTLDRRTESTMIGFVQQSPEHQLVTDKVWHELAFGLESLGCDTPTIRRRVAEIAEFFGISDWFYRDTADLSGGQKQLLNLASVMVMQPSVLILDEPTSQLDPIAASNFLSMLRRINRELGTTVILSEHRLEETLPISDRAAVLSGGRLCCIGTPQEIGSRLREENRAMFAAMPTAMRVWTAVDGVSPCPVTVRDAQVWLKEFTQTHPTSLLPPEQAHSYPAVPAVAVNEAFFRYEQAGADVVRGLSLQLQQGEFLALLGGNGAGKSTVLKMLAGMCRPYRGKLTVNGRTALLPQDVQTLFVKNTVWEELRNGENAEDGIDDVIRLCHLTDLLDRHPYDLSGGEQQRTALAKVLLTKPDILLLDEPTKGMDAAFKAELAGILQTLLRRGVSILMVSHDVAFCAEYAHRCALLFDGSIVSAGTPREFFGGNSFYTTSANRIARGIFDSAVTAEDLIVMCGGSVSEGAPPETLLGRKPVELTAQKQKERSKAPLPRKTILSVLVFLLLIPLTVIGGAHLFGNRKYYFISLLVLLECMLPFFAVFEGRKPRARDIVTVSVLCALGIAGRAALFMLPQCKPVMALAILAGASLGGETGFLVGAVSMLVSNIMFSQGPWTPWQMFAMGLIGFLSGVLFRKKEYQTKALLCLFGAFAAVFIYGGLMNPASALMWAQEIDLKILLPYYLSGFPMDCVQAAATAVFLWIFAEPMLEKLERVKTKYLL